MNICNKKFFAALGLCLSGAPLHADQITVSTDKPIGSVLTLALNAGVSATVMWDDAEETLSEVVFTGDFLDIPVQGKTLVLRTEQPVHQLFCSDNALTSLSVNGLSQLKTLVCDDNALTSLSLYSNTALQELSCQRNQLRSLSLLSNKELKSLNVAQNPLLTLTLSEADGLEDINVSQTALPRFYGAKYPRLRYCVAQEGSLSDLTLPAGIEVLCAGQNELKQLSLDGCSQVKELWLSDNQLTALDLEDLDRIEGVVAERNQLREMLLARGARASLKKFFVSGNVLFYNSFPTPSQTLSVGVSGQQDYSLGADLEVDEVLELDDLLSRNAWRNALHPQVVWKYVENHSPVPESICEPVGETGFRFTEPVGQVYAEVTTSVYPGVVLKLVDINVGDVTGLNDVKADSGWSVSSGKGVVRFASSRKMKVRIVRADGVTVLAETVSPGSYTWALPKGIYLVNQKKIMVK